MEYSDEKHLLFDKENTMLGYLDRKESFFSRLLPCDDTDSFVLIWFFSICIILSVVVIAVNTKDGVSVWREHRRIEARQYAEIMQPEWNARMATVDDVEKKAHEFAQSDNPPARWIRETNRFDVPVASTLPTMFRCRPNDNLLRVYETARGEPMHQYKACCQVGVGKQPNCLLSRSW
jgi:hypothetical protein